MKYTKITKCLWYSRWHFIVRYDAERVRSINQTLYLNKLKGEIFYNRLKNSFQDREVLQECHSLIHRARESWHSKVKVRQMECVILYFSNQGVSINMAMNKVSNLHSHVFVCLGSILFSVGPLCICVISAWLRLGWSRHKHNMPLGFWYGDKAVAPFGHFVYP